MVKRWKIPFLDLKISRKTERQKLLSAINNVFEHGQFILGPEVQKFEEFIARLCNTNYAVGVGSGTDALILALKCLGIGPGDEVITSSLSWIATANSISLVGATPVFADIEEDLNISTSSIERLINTNTKAIMPVHYTGKVCDMTKVMILADKYNLHVVEDASQSLAAYHRGKIAGSFGHVACFSMNPMKILSGCGEAGIIVTNNSSYHEKLRSLRYNGTINKEVCVQASHNSRLDTVQAAILLERYKYLDDIINRRRRNASIYNNLLRDIVSVPTEITGDRDVYYTYQIKTDSRDELQKYLTNHGVETKIQHPILMYQQPYYETLNNVHNENAEKLLTQILCLPVHEKLIPDDIRYVANVISEFYK